MTAIDRSEKSGDEHKLETLTDQAMKLLQMDLDQLHATLGSQLLVYDLPTRSAEVVSHLSPPWDTSGNLPTEFEGSDSGGRGQEIFNELQQDGKKFLVDVREKLRSALCCDQILSLSEETNRSTIQILIILVGGTLKMPLELESVSVTVTAILIKLGLRNFCDSTAA